MSSPKLPLILITGATATGKTQISLRVCDFLKKNGHKVEIINADSLLFYPELNIGTAKPSPEERSFVPHHLIDCTTIEQPLNASDYVSRALPIIKNLHNKETIPLIVGGSAFYIRALMKGMYESGETPAEISFLIQSIEKKEGWTGIRKKLAELDPESEKRIHSNDRYRTIRALEYSMTHDRPYSKAKEEKDEDGPYNFNSLQNKAWRLHHHYLLLPKDFHWEIMEKRTREMLKNGLIDEVRGLLEKGFSPSLKPLQSIGYKETIDFLEGRLSENELVERIFINTRRLSKSQKTFFKKIEPKLTRHPIQEEDVIMKEIKAFIDGFYE